MWCNKEDVINDLAVFTGEYIPQDLDSNYFVCGENPPPRRTEVVEDDELSLRFGSNICQNIPNGRQKGPDLAGIKEMLKAVKETDYDSDDEIIVPDTNKAVIVSKLNPNVSPFIPKAANKQDQQKAETVNTKEEKCLTSSNVKENVASSSIVEEHSTSKPNGNTINGLRDVNIKAENLKNKISLAKNTSCYEIKGEKNLAISSLLKLYTKKPPGSSTYKLMTPNDFMNLGTVSKVNKNRDENAEKEINVETSPELNVFTVNDKTDQEPISIKTESVKEENPVATESVESIESDPEIRNSIKKVTSWLNGSSSGKSTPTNRPITFASPTEMFKKKDKKPQNQGPKAYDVKYQPSNHAEELTKMYKERQKAQELKYDKVTWNNLGDVLKQKDDALRTAPAKNLNKNNVSSTSKGVGEDGDHI